MAKLVGARAYNSGNISIPNVSATVITLDSERFDTDNIHDTSSNTSRLTCKTAGKYLIAATIQWAADADGERLINIKLDGTTMIGRVRHSANSDAASPTVQNLAIIYDLSVNQYVEVWVYHNEGAALNVENETNSSPEFMMHRIG